jgi:hypothetical protein
MPSQKQYLRQNEKPLILLNFTVTFHNSQATFLNNPGHIRVGNLFYSAN